MVSTIQWFLVGSSCSLQEFSMNILPKLTDGLNHPMVPGWWLLLLLLFSVVETVSILLSCSWSQPPSGLWLMVYAWWFVVDFYGGSYGWCFKCSWWLCLMVSGSYHWKFMVDALWLLMVFGWWFIFYSAARRWAWTSSPSSQTVSTFF